MLRLMLKAKAAQAQPSLIVVFDSGDLVLFSVRSSLVDEDTSLVFTAVYFIMEKREMYLVERIHSTAMTYLKGHHAL